MNKHDLGISLIVFLFLLLCLEAGTRIWQRHSTHAILVKRPVLALYANIKNPEEIFSSVPQESLEWAPYELWAIRPNLLTRFYHTNALGFRGQEITLKKPSKLFRIVVMGGSAAWGFGCTSDERTMPGRLQSILREQFPGLDLEVINAGQIGFNSTQELIYFHRKVNVLAPDLVLLFDGYNDILADFKNPVSGWPLHSELLKNRFEDAYYPHPLRKDILALLCHSRFMEFMIRRVSERGKTRAPLIPSVKPSTTAENYLKNVLAFERLVEPTVLWVALQPIPALTQKALAPEEIKIIAEKEQAIQSYKERVKLTYQGMKEGLRSKGIETIDLEQAFGPEPKLMFVDECHFGDEAADRIARFIAGQWMKESAILKSAKTETELQHFK